MPSIILGNPVVYQAYFLNQQEENPIYVNQSVEFSVFSTNNIPIWKIGNKTIDGQNIIYTFKRPGNYIVVVSVGNKTSEIIEKVLSESALTKIITLDFNGTGTHLIKTNMSGTGVYIWYVHGQPVEGNFSNIAYNFKYYGSYYTKVFVINSYGNKSQTFIINIVKQNTYTVLDILLFVYNTAFPIILLLYLVNRKFKLLVDTNITKLWQILVYY